MMRRFIMPKLIECPRWPENFGSPDNELVTVGIITHNEASIIRRCLESVVSQTFPSKCWRLIVLDNNSSDHTVDMVRSFLGGQSLIKWQVMGSDQNNIGSARAQIISETQTKLVAFTDPDCVVSSDWLEKLVTKFIGLGEIWPVLAGVGGENVAPIGVHRFYDLLLLFKYSFVGHLNSPQMKGYCQDEPAEHLPTCNAIYDRRAILKVGNFSVQMNCVCEDVEIGCRLRKNGFLLVMTGEIKVTHFLPTALLPWIKRMYRFGQGQAMVMTIHPSHLTPRLFLPLLLGGFVFSSVVALMAQGVQVLSAIATGWVFYIIVVFTLLSVSKIKRNQASFAEDNLRSPHTLAVLALMLSSHLAYSAGMVCQLAFCESFRLRRSRKTPTVSVNSGLLKR